jgi:hypothetical protein
MKKMISTLLTAVFTFTGLGFTGFQSVTASAAETDQYIISETVTVLTQEEADEINSAYEAEIGRASFDYELLHAGDIRLDLFATAPALSSLYISVSYDSSAVQPKNVDGSNQVFYQEVSGCKNVANPDGYINVENSIFSFGYASLSRPKTLNGHALGSLFLKALVPFENESSVLSCLTFHLSESQLYTETTNSRGKTVIEETDLVNLFCIEDTKVVLAPIPGDIDGDGMLKIADAVLMMRCLCEGSEGTAATASLHDLNGDGFTDILDVCWLLDLLSNL